MATRDEQIKKAFGVVLRDLRRERGLTQDELAYECDFDRTYISLLERAMRQPSLTTIFKLAEKLEIKPGEIVRRIGQRIRNR